MTYTLSFFIFNVCWCVSVWVCARGCSARGGQKRAVDTELKLQKAGSHPVWCWELNLGPLREQCAPLTAEPRVVLKSLKCDANVYAAMLSVWSNK